MQDIFPESGLQSGVMEVEDITEEVEDVAEILKDFQRQHVDEDGQLTVVARRRRILHSTLTALNNGFFDWHKQPQDRKHD
ncbi:30S ribosomal protein S15 [Dissostichus eleginoides]|uniref:30S ribosomal protein S15 n=1 Tax=Dissostichus eleginoides TaxID=100907 RepID=A0AAD9CAV2_DISEL|nr:30S ribosomal protein S15 [Dissostichus eleginoides]